MIISKTEPTLEQRIIQTMRLRHYSRQTEQGHVMWYKQFVRFHSKVSGRLMRSARRFENPVNMDGRQAHTQTRPLEPSSR